MDHCFKIDIKQQILPFHRSGLISRLLMVIQRTQHHFIISTHTNPTSINRLLGRWATSAKIMIRKSIT